MKRALIALSVLLFAASTSGLNAQLSRRPQFEFYGGLALPMAPEGFKEYMQMGLSGNVQYVIFPSPRFGITVNLGYESFITDNDRFTNFLSTSLTGYDADYWINQGYDIDPSAEISAAAIRFGGGVRPYITPPESNMQFFLLAQANYNLLNYKFTAADLPAAYDYTASELWVYNFDDNSYEETFGENDENVVGFGFGAGIEIPAGNTYNIVIQALYSVLNTSEESTSFLTLTAGLVF